MLRRNTLRKERPSRPLLVTAAVLVLLLVATSLATRADAAADDDVGLAGRQKVRQRQQRLLGYAKRVSGAMGTVIHGQATGSGAYGDDTLQADEDGKAAQAGRDAELAARRQRRAHLGLDTESASGGPLRWASVVKDAMQRTRASLDETMSAVVNLALVSVGAPLPGDAEEELSARAEPKVRTLQMTREQRLRERRLTAAAARSASEPEANARTLAATRNGTPVRATSEAERVTFDVQQGDLAYSCRGGVQAFSPDSTWQCTDGTTVDAEACLTNARDCAATCKWTSGEVTCICARDAVLYRSSKSAVCLERALDLRPELPEPDLCQDELSASLGLARTSPGEYCLTAKRTDSLSFAVTYRFALLSDADITAIKNAGDSIIYPSFGRNSTRWVVAVGNAATTSGTYDELSLSSVLFSYVSPPTNLTDFAITTTHEAVRLAKVFTAVFSFSAPEVMPALMRESSLSSQDVAAAYLGRPDGMSTHTTTYDLSTVPDECVEGNQLYIEVGVGGPGVYLTYRVARIHVAFPDLPPPPVRFKYPKEFNILYIFLIALIAAIVVGCALAVVWYCCQKQEDPEDDLVAKAQRNKTRKEEIERGKDEKMKRRSGIGGGHRVGPTATTTTTRNH